MLYYLRISSIMSTCQIGLFFVVVSIVIRSTYFGL